MPETAHIAANAAAPYIAGAALCLLAPEETIGGVTCPVCCTRDICNWIEFSDSGANRTCIAIESVISTSDAGLQISEFEPQLESEDGNKNVSDLIGADQTVAANYSYTPFGALLSSSGSSSPSNPFCFSSEHADDALGLVYYNYRHYNPEIGRWMSRDPLEEEGGANIYLIESFVFSTDFLGSYRIRNNCNGIKVDIEAAFFKISQKIVELLNTAKAPTRATKIQKKDASDNRKSIVGEISSIFAVLGIKAGERWRNFDAIKARLSNILAQSQRDKGVSVDCCPDRLLGSHPCNMPMNAGSAAAMHKGVLYLCAGAIEDPEKYGGWDCLILHELLHLELPPINSSNFGTRQGMNIEKLNVRLCSYLLGHRCHVEAYGE